MSIDLNSPYILFRKHSEDHLRQIIHWLEPYTLPDNAEEETPTYLATSYMQDASEVYESGELIDEMNVAPSVDLNKDFTQLRLLETVEKFNDLYFFYSQTYFGIPMWNQGMVVEVRQEPLEKRRSISSVDHNKISIPTPNPEALDNYSNITVSELESLLNVSEPNTAIINSSDNLCIYQYRSEKRIAGDLPEGFLPEGYDRETLPDVSSDIVDGNYYIVRQVYFSLGLHWRCFIEITTGSILYLEIFCACATGQVMKLDPKSQGATLLTPPLNVGTIPSTNPSNPALNQFRSNETLHRLDPPDPSGNQHLRGQYARVIDPVLDVNDPMLATPYPANALVPAATPPTEVSPFDFNYNVRTENFGAVNCYYQVDRFLDFIVSLGIQLKPTAQDPTAMLPNTPLPIRVDHRAFESSQNTPIGGGCVGNIGNTLALGIAFAKITLSTPPSPPLDEYYSAATSYQIMLHELSHVLLLDHLHTPGFTGFSHSFGDSLAAILNDINSVYAPPSTSSDRFVTFPWEDTNSGQQGKYNRRHDRDTQMSNGWYWGGSQDTGSISYNSEQLLSTTLFKAYRALGGDDTNPLRREFAARMICAVILKTVRNYAATSSYVFFVSSPPDAGSFCADLRYRDTYFVANELPIQVDGVRMGTSHKVITWAFEKLAAFNLPSPTPPNPPAPPTYDIYIDDGRNGEYNYITNFWNTTEIFNRHQNDGQTNQTHQNPSPNTTNYLFVRVKNRGQLNADNILVNGYRCTPGGGMVWPQDWILLNSNPVSGGSGLTLGNSRIVGPITWTPPTGQNHVCLLFTVEALGDVPHTWYPIPNTVIPDWHLVPSDNNIAQRNLNLLAGYLGSIDVAQAADASGFLVRNPYEDPIGVDLEIHLPQLLRNNGWSLSFDTSNHIDLEGFDREGVPVKITLSGGHSFTREDIQNTDDRDIVITMISEKGIIGGLTYRIDPDLRS
ncbi:MAG: hypothetical protein JSS64_13950 [Bacteroidetes bacterium]|nr:hypothetical protein [Bacteroidota bacterium]